MIACSQEAFEDRFDAAGAAALGVTHASDLDPTSGRYLSDEYRDYRVTMESAIGEISHLLQHIQEKGGVNRHTAERIGVFSPDFINPTRPLASFTSDYTKTNYHVSQEGLMDTLRTFKDNIVKFLAALINKVTDWIMNVFKSWRKDNDDTKDTLTDAEKAMKQYDQVFEEIADALRVIYLQTHPTPDSPSSMVCDVNDKIITSVGLSVQDFSSAGQSKSEVLKYFRQIRSDKIGAKVSTKLNAFLHKLVKGDAVARAIIQNFVLDVQKRLPEISARLEKVNRALVFNDNFTPDPLLRSQELINVAQALGYDSEVVSVMTDDIEDGVGTMLSAPMATFYSEQTEQELMKCDLMLDTLSGVDVSYLKQIKEIRIKGAHLTGVMNTRKEPLPEGMRETMIDLSDNIDSVRRVLEMLKVIGLQVRQLVLSLETAVDDINLLVQKFCALILKLKETSHIAEAAAHANRAIGLIP